MKQNLAQSAIVVAMAVGGPSVAGSAAAQPAQDQQNFGSHVSHCGRVMGGFSGGLNPTMMRGPAESLPSIEANSSKHVVVTDREQHTRFREQ